MWRAFISLETGVLEAEDVVPTPRCRGVCMCGEREREKKRLILPLAIKRLS